jgi:transcriptional regulator with XRE-family HTH domain
LFCLYPSEKLIRRAMEQLARLRELKGYSQRALAKESGVSPATIYELENGRRRPNPSTLRKLARALEVEVADLLGGEYPKDRSSSLEPTFNDVLEDERRRAERQKRIQALPGWIRAAVEDEEFVQRFEAAKSSLARAGDLAAQQRKERGRSIAKLRDLKERSAPPAELQAARRDLAQARARETACTIMDVDLWRGRDVADVRPVDIVAEVAAAQGDIVAALSDEADDFASEAG